MPVNTDNVKKAFDDFMEDNYSVAKDTIRQEIKTAKNDFIKNKLNISNDIESTSSDSEDDDE